jgi:hypothetical protein
MNIMDPSEYGPGKIGDHITWYGYRLVVHGFGRHYKVGPGPRWGDADEANTVDFQKAQGWSGKDADGLPGPETLKRLAADPKTEPEPEPVDIDITGWKLTVPYGAPEKPTEIKQPELNRTKSLENEDGLVVFERDKETGTLKFRANHGGVTTSGSPNPRSELREMSKDGSKNAKWSTTKGRHVMDVTLRINQLTHYRPYVVPAQIHGGEDDVTVLRLEGTNLWITNGDKSHGYKLTDKYLRGQIIRFSFIAEGGKIRFKYNGRLVDYEVKSSDSACYFKTGCYLQSNPKSAPDEDPDAFAEVELLGVRVEHT